MNKSQIEKRLDELQTQRAETSAALDAARMAAPQALIDGEKPVSTVPLVEELEALDAAIVKLTDQREGALESEARAARSKLIDRALNTTAIRKAKAAAVDDALAALAEAWSGYRESVRQSVGQLVSAGGDAARLNGVALNNRVSESLIKAMIKSSDMEMIRALGINTPIRPRHAITLADVEERVALSLRSELVRVKATSPQPNIAREARRELEELDEFLT